MKTINILPLQKPVKKVLTVPGSKSYTNRALLLAAISKNTVKLANPLFCDDTKAMINCLQTLGIRIETLKDSIRVISSIDDIKNGDYDLNASLSGTTIRFMLALATIIPGAKTLYGKKPLSKRPIGELVNGLRQLGAKIEYLGRQGYPPLRVLSSKLNPGVIKMNGAVSSQYLSAILMIAPYVGKVTIEVIEDQISKPYIDMTIDAMKKFGVDVVNQRYKKYIVSGTQAYKIQEYLIEGDFSSAGYFLAMAALTKSTIILKNLNPDSVQADKKMLDVLARMGSKIVYGINEVTVQGSGVKPIEIDMTDFPDQIQTLAVLASFAKGRTIIKGVESLRIKETDRLKAIKIELKKMSIRIKSRDGKLIIYGGNPKPSIIDTYGDHRMAMAFAVASTKLSGIKIKNPEVVTKTFPDFWEKLKEIGVRIV